MEQLGRVLPPIFKFAVLWNILPFYGFLHEWKILLEVISKQTSGIWKKNKEAFMYWGGEYRQEFRTSHDKIKKSDKEMFEYMSPYSFLYDKFLKDECLVSTRIFRLKELIEALLKKVNEYDVILLNNFSYDREQTITIWNKDNIWSYLPSIRWIKNQMESKSFLLSELKNWALYINKHLEFKPIMIRKFDSKIDVSYSTFSNILIWDSSKCIDFLISNQNKIYEVWPNHDCWCKPTKLLISNLFNPENDLDILILRIPFIENIKLISIAHDWSDYKDIKYLHSFVEKLPSSKVVFNLRLNITDTLLPSHNYDSSKMTMILNGELFSFEVNIQNKYVRGYEFKGIVTNSTDQFAIIHLSYFLASNWSFKSFNEKDIPDQEIIEKLKSVSSANSEAYIILRKWCLILNLEPSEIKDHLNDFQYCIHSNIYFSRNDSVQLILEWVNILPKEFEFKLHLHSIDNEDDLNLILEVISKFKKTSIIIKGFEIFILKHRDQIDTCIYDKTYSVFNQERKKRIKMTYDQVKQFILKL